MKKTTLLLISIILVSSVYAQSGARRSNRMMHKPNNIGMMDRDYHDENRGQMMAFRLTERLDLSVEQAEEFFPRMKDHREIMNQIDDEVFDATKDLRDKMRDNKDISDAELKNVLSKIDILKNKRTIERDQFLSSLDNVLDNKQIAMLALAPFHHKNDRMMKESKRPRKRR